MSSQINSIYLVCRGYTRVWSTSAVRESSEAPLLNSVARLPLVCDGISMVTAISQGITQQEVNIQWERERESETVGQTQLTFGCVITLLVPIKCFILQTEVTSFCNDLETIYMLWERVKINMWVGESRESGFWEFAVALREVLVISMVLCFKFIDKNCTL